MPPRPTTAAAADKHNSSPTSDVEEDSETGEEVYSSDVEGGAAADASLFGSMRTRLRWDAAEKNLHLDVR